MSSSVEPRDVRGWVLYDGSCGFCSRWVPFWKNTLARRGFDVALLQSEFVRERLGLSEDELLTDLRLLLADGGQVRGANVYRYITRRIWWATPVYLLAVCPGFRWVFDRGYLTFAKHRYRVSRVCRLPGHR